MKTNRKLLFLLYGLLAVVIAFGVSFSYLALRPYLTSLTSLISRTWQSWTAPKIEYSFKDAPGKTGFALQNENKAGGFKVLLGKTDSPKIPEARFEVKDSWLDMSLGTNVGESGFKKVTSSDVIPSAVEGTLANASKKGC